MKGSETGMCRNVENDADIYDESFEELGGEKVAVGGGEEIWEG